MSLCEMIPMQVCAIALSAGIAVGGESYVWPAPPDVARFAFVQSIDCRDVSPKVGALG